MQGLYYQQYGKEISKTTHVISSQHLGEIFFNANVDFFGRAVQFVYIMISISLITVKSLHQELIQGCRTPQIKNGTPFQSLQDPFKEGTPVEPNPKL